MAPVVLSRAWVVPILSSRDHFGCRQCRACSLLNTLLKNEGSSLWLAMPLPFQNAFAGGTDFVRVRNSHTFNPEKLPICCAGHDHPMPLVAWDLQVREQVLEFHALLHANRMKAVAGLPVPQSYDRPDFLRIEILGAEGVLRSGGFVCPLDRHAVEVN